MSSPDPLVIPTQRPPSNLTTPDPEQHHFRSPSGQRILVTVHDDGSVQVRMRVCDRWSAPFESEVRG